MLGLPSIVYLCKKYLNISQPEISLERTWTNLVWLLFPCRVLAGYNWSNNSGGHISSSWKTIPDWLRIIHTWSHGTHDEGDGTTSLLRCMAGLPIFEFFATLGVEKKHFERWFLTIPSHAPCVIIWVLISTPSLRVKEHTHIFFGLSLEHENDAGTSHLLENESFNHGFIL